VQQEELNFEQDVYLKVKQFDILRDRLLIGKESDENADRRYFIAQKSYHIAKISITDLNIALQEKDIAKRSYLATLRDYWQSYYQIRQLTMYDFERGEVITY
jgi:outer membrane protein TolC